MKCINMESRQDLLLNANYIPIMIGKEFTLECCVRGHRVYQSKQEAKVGSDETKPCALVEGKNAMALKQKDVTVRYVRKFLSKITYFYHIRFENIQRCKVKDIRDKG